MPPASPQNAHLVLAAHQRREATGRHDIEALLHWNPRTNLIDLERCGHTFKRRGLKIVTGKIPLDESAASPRDYDGIRVLPVPEGGRNVWRVAQG